MKSIIVPLEPMVRLRCGVEGAEKTLTSVLHLLLEAGPVDGAVSFVMLILPSN